MADTAYDFEIDEVDSEKLRKVFEDTSLTRAESDEAFKKGWTLKIQEKLLKSLLMGDS